MKCLSCNKEKELVMPEMVCLECLKIFDNWNYWQNDPDTQEVEE